MRKVVLLGCSNRKKVSIIIFKTWTKHIVEILGFMIGYSRNVIFSHKAMSKGKEWCTYRSIGVCRSFEFAPL